MSSGTVVPDRDTFTRLAASQPVVPVTRRLLADGETPIGVYEKLAAHRPGTFLLESAEHGRVWSRYSFVGVGAAATLTERSGQAVWTGTPPSGLPTGGDPLAALRATAAALHSPRTPDAPPLTGGLVGYLGYDAVRRLERLPSLASDDMGIPELAFLLTTDVAVLDHLSGTVLLVANVISPTDPHHAYDDALARLDRMTADLARPSPPTLVTLDMSAPARYERCTTSERYEAAVEQVKEQIRAGDAFQVVLSQRFVVPTQARALDIYRVLRVSNPSPYMYLLRFDGFDVVGSSPEALVKVEGDRAMIHPIAGTRPRGETPEQDAALAADLRADPKERAEHLMLVDLGRNDLGRVCATGSVEVVEFMALERFSHVMHLVSTVVGSVRGDVSAFDVLTACFPAGTLSGAPKPSAMRIIEELEPTRRGLYGGAVGYLGFSGNLDTAIAIRTALLRGGTAFVQAGAGIVADSRPEAEDAECRSKAATVLGAVAAAGTMTPPAGMEQ